MGNCSITQERTSSFRPSPWRLPWLLFSIDLFLQLVKYVQNRCDQLRITKACHVDPTSGHLGVKKTVGRVKERFMWKGVWSDVRNIVSRHTLKCSTNNYNYIFGDVGQYLWWMPAGQQKSSHNSSWTASRSGKVTVVPCRNRLHRTNQSNQSEWQ